MKLTEEHIQSVIATEDYKQVGNKTTVCLLTLINGYEVIGTSACVDPAEYSYTTGTKLAKECAVEKVWELEGYLLQEKTHLDAVNR